MNFWKKYGGPALVVFIVGLIIVYIFFTVPGCIPVGEDLNKTAWLSFVGGYLAFASSVFLGVVALWQNEKANELSEKSFKISKDMLDYELYTKIPDISIEFSKLNNVENLRSRNHLDRRDYRGADKLIVIRPKEVKDYIELGHFIIKVTCCSDERVINFQLVDTYFHKLKGSDIIHFTNDYHNDINFRNGDKEYSICVKICGVPEQEVEHILNDDFKMNMRFEFYNSLNRKLSCDCCFAVQGTQLDMLVSNVPCYIKE